MKLLFAFSLCLMLTGCYRTHYVNFSPDNPQRMNQDSKPVRVSSWRSFFVYGWAPGEMFIDAEHECGRHRVVESIRTQRTFLEGLVAAFAGYYINIYSPWDGAVYCQDRMRLKLQRLCGAPPEGWKASFRAGDQHYVWRYKKEPDDASGAAAYFGYHPKPRAPKDAVATPGMLLGQPTQWRTWADEQGVHSEAVLDEQSDPARSARSPLRVHGWVYATERQEADILRAWLGTASVCPRE